jgi:hypothetical protein
MTPMIDPTADRAHRFSIPKSYGLTLALLLLQIGCAANTPAEAVSQKTGPYYQDAQLCRARNPAKNLAAGADPAANLNTSGYLKCMNQLGYQQDAKTDPLLVALKKCQQQGTATVSARGATTVKPPSHSAVRTCLKQRGFPSAGKPPAPADTSAHTAPPASAGSAAPAATLKIPANSTKKSASAKDSKERVQTIYIPRKTPSAQ